MVLIKHEHEKTDSIRQQLLVSGFTKETVYRMTVDGPENERRRLRKLIAKEFDVSEDCRNRNCDFERGTRAGAPSEETYFAKLYQGRDACNEKMGRLELLLRKHENEYPEIVATFYSEECNDEVQPEVQSELVRRRGIA